MTSTLDLGNRFRRRRRLLIAVAAMFALAAGAGYAAIPHSQTGVIDACYDAKGGGALRVIDAENGETCGATEVPLNWNVQGPPGPMGPQGATGKRGPAGPTSTIMRSITHTTQQGYGEVATVWCGPGEVATGGGYELVSGIPSNRMPSVIASKPEGNSSVGAIAWQVRWYWTPAGEQWEVYAVCAPA